MIFCGDDFLHSSGVLGRLAPSPTGLLHLGNAWAFWAAWLAARAVGGKIILRIEDIDPVRSREEYVDASIEDLQWLGLDWDYGPGSPGYGSLPEIRRNFFWQSRRSGVYDAAVSFLAGKELVYPCYCTRKELREIAGAPHIDDRGAPYPGICRHLSLQERAQREHAGRPCALRLLCPDDELWTFNDHVLGRQDMTLAQCGGDFALRRSDGVYAYQLAVVVDDAAVGVTHVVRGNDILQSTPRQLYLYSLLGKKAPEYAHVPLVTDENGERLAKRHASLTVRSLRNAGVAAQTIVGWLAFASGLRETFTPMFAAEGVAGFSFAGTTAKELRLPPDPTAFFLDLQNHSR